VKAEPRTPEVEEVEEEEGEERSPEISWTAVFHKNHSSHHQ